jgi:RNA polymerase sigma factor (sigma-70 family)
MVEMFPQSRQAMAANQMSAVIRHLHKAMLVQEVPDGQLLESFVSRREAAALETLVRRHGPMVWNVCRRVVHNHQDAEDAFQATFLVFVRKAASIVPRELVGNWLYGVAHQTALKTRATAAKRRTREKQVTEMPETAKFDKDDWTDLAPVLDQELTQLPDKYRAVIVLCVLEGKTRSEAARQLCWPEGTVAGRLARARTALAKRLTQRGVVLSGGLLAAMLSQQAASACLQAAVMTTTIKTAALAAAGQAAATAIPAKVAALTEGVVKAMFLSQLKKVTAIVAMLWMAVCGGGLLTYHIASAQQYKFGPELPADGAGDDLAACFVPDRRPMLRDPEPPKDFANGIGMKFVWIPPGTFMMGSLKEEPEREDNETRHKVRLTKGIYMGVYVVTQEQWQEVIGNNLSHFQGEKNLPVERVSWDDCQAFVKKLQQKDKKAYRLPTESEWEYCCRAGTTTPFYLGETISTGLANYNGLPFGNGKLNAANGIDRKKTTPVGSFPANAWGLYDMHGNVYQWCQDWHGEYPHNDNAVDPQGPNTGKYRVLRGGSWCNVSSSCRSAYRNFQLPGNHEEVIGFRLCFFME